MSCVPLTSLFLNRWRTVQEQNYCCLCTEFINKKAVSLNCLHSIFVDFLTLSIKKEAGRREGGGLCFACLYYPVRNNADSSFNQITIAGEQET